MDFVKLNINREMAYVAAAMPYRIFINGEEKCKIGMGKSTSIDIPNEKCTLKISMVGNSMSFGKIEKEITLYPNNCQKGFINCNIRTRANMLSVFTMGLTKKPMATIVLDVDYF